MTRGRATFRTYSVVADRLDFSHPNGTLLRLVREHDGIWRLFIEVSENTTQAELRQAAPLACEFRDKLLALQGPEDQRLLFVLALDQLQRTRRMSYGKLAMSVSGLIYALAEDVVESERRDSAVDADFASRNALKHLGWCGFNTEDASEALQECVEAVKDPRRHRRPDSPVARDKVRDMVYSFRKSALGRAARKDASNDIQEEIKKYCAEQYARLLDSRRINPFLYDSSAARTHKAVCDSGLEKPETRMKRKDRSQRAK